jgi:hypothetical protein
MEERKERASNYIGDLDFSLVYYWVCPILFNCVEILFVPLIFSFIGCQVERNAIIPSLSLVRNVGTQRKSLQFY